MAHFERCKACGLVMIAGKYEICPACGVKKSAFEPFHDKVPHNRRIVLDLHIHPILVHFPQTISSILFTMLIGALILSGDFSEKLLHVADIMAYLLPISIPPAFLSGILDGFVRYKRLDTPYMIYKTLVGIILMLISIAIAIITFYGDSREIIFYNIFLTLLSLACQVYLGRVGARLMFGIMPGKLKWKDIFKMKKSSFTNLKK